MCVQSRACLGRIPKQCIFRMLTYRNFHMSHCSKHPPCEIPATIGSHQPTTRAHALQRDSVAFDEAQPTKKQEKRICINIKRARERTRRAHKPKGHHEALLVTIMVSDTTRKLELRSVRSSIFKSGPVNLLEV